VVKLELDEDDAELLGDVLDVWIEENDTAREETITDKSLEDPEDLLTAVAGLQDIRARTISMRQRLHDARFQPRKKSWYAR
jgi:hypothetical protein